MSQESVQARAIFIDAVENVQPERWPEYLDEACGDDATLRDKVQRLLDAHGDIGSFMDKPAAAPVATVDQPITEKPGTQIGPYKLLQQLGEGGMGVVYMAEQKEPVKRRVALKIIKPGMDTRQVIARFEAERQALAMMDHPNIARVLDGGMTEQGRPYFAMEYVKGVPLIEYCDNAKLSVRERLELFVPICKAVQHAHQKGVIHRDLKPSNILVCLYDGKPVPKVIDFGLAKAIHQSLTEKTLFTAHGMMVGTPLYMSPEQAESNNLDVDTRTDIYSLGVILYELLTGSTPLEKAQLKTAAVGEILRLIKEVEPPRPSTRISGSQPEIAAQRGIEKAQLARDVTGDLDWVVMKALEKERSRRYETANGLAEDILRHLSDEPVSASPPSTTYKLSKLVKRNKGLFTAAATVLITLTLGLIGASWGLIAATRASRQLHAANVDLDEALQDANEQRELAQQNELTAIAEAKRAERELARAKEVRQLIDDMFSSITPEEASGEDVTLLKKILDDAAERLMSGQIEDEAVTADMHSLIGFVYTQLGLAKEAERHRKAAVDLVAKQLGHDHLYVQLNTHGLAAAIGNQGRFTDAERLLRPLLVELEDAKTAKEKRLRFAVMNDLGANLHNQRRFNEAKEVLERVLKLQSDEYGEDSIFVLPPMGNLVNVYLELEDFERAEAMCHEAIGVVNSLPEDAYKASDITTPPGWVKEVCIEQLGYIHSRQRRYEEAKPFIEEVLAIREKKYREQHPITQHSIVGLADLYFEMERYDKARTQYERALALNRRYLGPSNPQTRHALWGLARTFRKLGMPEEFAELARELVGLLTGDPPTMKLPAGHLRWYAWRLVRPQPESTRQLSAELALVLAQKSLAMEQAQGGTSLGSVFETRARVYVEMGEWEKAIADYDRAVKEEPELVVKTFGLRRRAYAALEQWEKAAALGWQLVEQNPANEQNWQKAAPLIAYDGDKARYSEFCKRMVKQFGDVNDVLVAEKLCKSCLLLPGAIDVAELPGEMLGRKIDDGKVEDWFPPWGWGTRALLAYRNNQPDLAIQYANEAEKHKPTPMAHALNLAVLAMANQKGGDQKAAEQALQELSQIVAHDVYHHDMLNAQILLKEAELKVNKN